MALITTALATKLVATFKEELVALVKDLKDEAKYFFDSGLPNYVEAQYNKFYLTKTFIHRSEPVPFDKTYYPVTISNSKGKFKLETNPWAIFEESNYIGIIGQAGSGKSMLMKYMFLNTVQTYIKIPIVIELINMNDFNGSITDYIYETIFNNKLSPNKKIIEKLLTSGQFLILFDGYDELSALKKREVTKQIDSFIDKYGKNYFLITSRPEAGLESLPRFYCYSVEDLSNTEVEEFINIQLVGEEPQKLAEKIIQAINNPNNKEYLNYLQNPLLLSMFILTFEYYPQLPKLKSKFYWNVFDTLCVKHDSITKGSGFQHERKTNLQNEELENILKWLSYTSYFEGKLRFDRQYLVDKLKAIKRELNYDFHIEDLIYDFTVSIAIIVRDGLEYKLPHKTMQEYFVAALIKEQSEENKIKVYKDKMEATHIGFSRDFNFWNLCFEMDKHAFTTYFLLYNLRSFQKKANELGIERFVEVFGKEVSLRYGFIINHKKRNAKPGGSALTITRFVSICRYLDVPSPHRGIGKMLGEKAYYLLTDSACENIFRKRKKSFLGVPLKDGEENIEIILSDKSIWKNEKIYEILKQSGILKVITEFCERIDKKIQELENDISGEQTIRTNLLGF